jgi:hypothetical protein
MALRVDRRDFIAALGGAATWPFCAFAQQPDRRDRRGGRTTPVAVPTTQPAVPVIGFLNSASPGPFEPFVGAFRRGLKEVGFVERGVREAVGIRLGAISGNMKISF